MNAQPARNPHIIGLTGSFGSGCSYIAQHILEPKGYRRISLSDGLRDAYRKAKAEHRADEPERRALQDFGDELRRDRGPDVLANMALGQIGCGLTDQEAQKWVVDSIRNPAEVRALRNFSRNFFLIGVYADTETRWGRVHSRYADNRIAFDEDDKNDAGEESEAHGQRVRDCFSEADVILANNKDFMAVGNKDFKALEGRVHEYADLVAAPLAKRQPLREEEALMAMAYAAGQRSSCMKRKVGAIIVDGQGNVVSSGFNEVPMHEMPCSDVYRSCHRERLREDVLSALTAKGLVVTGRDQELKEEFRRQFRMLDYCRALHAEENAILNLAKNGRSVPLHECCLYTTTYPCRLCANKIVNIGLKRIVYLEPYPDQEAKHILKTAGVSDDLFEGVTFKAYFRIYGEEK